MAWVNEDISVCAGTASQGDGHVEILGNLADLLMDEESAHILRTTSDAQVIKDLILKGA